jgi:short-subunit dehydrogenase
MTKNSRKVAIVTGASSGIGRESAAVLASAGYLVFGTSRRANSSGPNGITMLQCDVTDDGSVAEVVTTVLNQAGRIDVLVNNAGSGMFGGVEEFSTEEVKALFDVNVFGIHRFSRAVLPTMRSQASGRIINVGSLLGLIPSPHMGAYSATKFAIEGYSESLDHEVRQFGVRVVVVEPGFTNTSFEDSKVPPREPMPLYEVGRAGLDVYLEKLAAEGDTPAIVAKAVLRAATDKTPKLRYPSGKVARQVSLLRRLVPSAMFDKTLRKQMGLPV